MCCTNYTYLFTKSAHRRLFSFNIKLVSLFQGGQNRIYVAQIGLEHTVELRMAWDADPPASAPCSAKITVTCIHTQLLSITSFTIATGKHLLDASSSAQKELDVTGFLLSACIFI